MRRPLRAVIFDIDGTLTKPCLDFKEWRRQLQAAFPGHFAPGRDLLEEAASLSPESSRRAHAFIHGLEEEGRSKFALQSGAAEVLQLLATHAIPRAVITRNSRATIDQLHGHLEAHPHEMQPAFHVSVGREFVPCKPAPEPALYVLEQLGVPKQHSRDVWFIGDSIDDLKCARAADIVAVLIRNRHHDGDERFVAHGGSAAEEVGLHDHAFDTLMDLRAALEQHLTAGQ